MEQIQTYINQAISMLIDYTPRVILALLTLWIGLGIIGAVTKKLSKGFEKRGMEPTIRPFLSSLVSWSLKALLFVSVASMIGITTTSFVAVLGAAGLAVGLALQGTLGNFAGGVLIMIFKPFRVGHLIEAQGHLGSVEEIQIFVTKLVTFENKTIYLPNGSLSNGNITNYSEKGKIRVDLSLGISPKADLAKAKAILVEVMKNHPKVVASPAPFVGVEKLTELQVTLAVKPHCHPDDFWTVFFDIQEGAKLALDKAGIERPMAQREVFLHQS